MKLNTAPKEPKEPKVNLNTQIYISTRKTMLEICRDENESIASFTDTAIRNEIEVRKYNKLVKETKKALKTS